MGYKSPLYGRRTGQLPLKQIPFVHILDYIGRFEQAVEFYSVFGGTPAYIIETDPEKDVFTNIEDTILREDSFLYRDVEFVLRQELTEPRYYFSILQSIAKGNHRIGLIANDTGLSVSIVNKYLSVLSDLQLVYRMIPVTESYKSRKGMHFLADNMFDFWFRFVYPDMEAIEKGKGAMVTQNIKPRFNQYVGRHFKTIVQEILEVLNERELLPFQFTQVGKWWHKEEEIDVVALNEKIKSIIFCECKWSDNVNATKIIRKLREKAGFVPVESEKEYYMIFAKSFRKRTDEEDVIMYDLEDMERQLMTQQGFCGNEGGSCCQGGQICETLDYFPETSDCLMQAQLSTAVRSGFVWHNRTRKNRSHNVLNTTAPNSHNHALARRGHILQKRLPADHKRMQEPVQVLRIQARSSASRSEPDDHK
uniref:DUF234 domain-containing protein n=1 Tax=Candidatus Methanogaster sp. ANME-2c ERB4 TaxID=2759911 RepID=A0A7G9YHY5_9EURY|nr:hypothetical protein PGBELJNO_00017 [Methanosarcinales archaeon ANME-2c ERB4]